MTELLPIQAWEGKLLEGASKTGALRSILVQVGDALYAFLDLD